MRSVWLVLLVHCSIIAPWNRDSKWKKNLTNIGFNHHSSSEVQPTGSENQLVGRFYIESWPSKSYTSSPTINFPIFLHRTWSQCLATLNHMDLKIIYMFLSFMFVWRGVCNMDLALNDWLPMHSMDVAKPLHKRIKRPYVSKRRSWHAVACRILTGSTKANRPGVPKCIIS